MRDITPDDYAQVAAITRAAYVDSGLVEPENTGYIAALMDVAARAEGPGKVIVAERDGVVVGSVWLISADAPEAEVARGDEMEFRMLVVDPKVHRSGAGRELVQAAFQWGQSHGFSGVAITSLPTMIAAHRLYESQGFVHAPERDWSLFTKGWVEEPSEYFLVFAKTFSA